MFFFSVGEVCFTVFGLVGDVRLPESFLNDTQKFIELSVYMTCVSPTSIAIKVLYLSKLLNFSVCFGFCLQFSKLFRIFLYWFIVFSIWTEFA